jgi:hypothetical protein
MMLSDYASHNPTIRTWDDNLLAAKVVVCSCGWKITWFDLENLNTLIIIIAEHWLYDHDCSFDSISNWLSQFDT